MSKFYFSNIFGTMQYFFNMAFLIKILALVTNFSVWSKLMKVEASSSNPIFLFSDFKIKTYLLLFFLCFIKSSARTRAQPCKLRE